MVTARATPASPEPQLCCHAPGETPVAHFMFAVLRGAWDLPMTDEDVQPTVVRRTVGEERGVGPAMVGRPTRPRSTHTGRCSSMTVVGRWAAASSEDPASRGQRVERRRVHAGVR